MITRKCEWAIRINISYELTPDDTLAFTQFHQLHSPTLRKQRIGSLAIGVVVLSLLPAFILLTSDKPFVQTAAAIWPLLAGPPLFAVFAGPYLKWKTSQLTKRVLNEGRNADCNVKCTMELDSDGFREVKASGESARCWSSVEKVVVTSSHLFVYTSGIEAYIVPRRNIGPAAFDEFVTSVASYSGLEVQQG